MHKHLGTCLILKGIWQYYAPKTNQMYPPPPTEVDNYTLTLRIMQTIRSKGTKKITTTYTIRDSVLQKTNTVWGVFRDSSQQNLPLPPPKHFEDLSAHLQLSWDNLQGEVCHPIIRGMIGRLHIQTEGDIHWWGKQKYSYVA